MKNQVYRGAPTNRRFALCPSTIAAGDAVLVGKQPAVALNSYSAATGGTVFEFSGSFTLTVIGESDLSPGTPVAIPPGGAVFASGTLDGTTGVTHTLTISATPGDTPFGHIDPSYTAGVGSGLTDSSAMVRLLGSE